MIDQLIIGNKQSFDDFGASIATRKIGLPKKKEVKDTVPYSNYTYDFSKINGELYWEERELEYVFEITADNPEELEEAKASFSAWVMNVMNEEIHDPFIFGYHFLGTYSDIDFEDDESLEKTTVTVKFTAYPYKIADTPDIFEAVIPASSTISIDVINESSHRVTPTLITDRSLKITIDEVTYTIGEGETTISTIMLKEGLNAITIKNLDVAKAKLSIKFYKEVF